MADTVQILETSSHTSGTQTLKSEKVKGDAYFGTTDGLHTVMIDLAGFIGTIKIQGSLADDPAETDWFDAQLNDGEFQVDTSGKVTKIVVESITYASAETSIKVYNTTGNFVWLRANISDWTAGTITRIEMNR
tara:strand:+ start:12497 stop:12895 length:399 start_codon:yes stop_codon:yes gene_type:complete